MDRLEEIKRYTAGTDWQPKANSLWLISEIERLKEENEWLLQRLVCEDQLKNREIIAKNI